MIYFNAYLLIPVNHLYICLFTKNGLSPKRARLKHQVPLLKVHFNLKRSKYYGNIVHTGLHIGSRSSSVFCDFIYYNITQNVQKTQLYLLTTTLPLHTDTYLQKYPNFVSKSHLKPRTTKSQKIVLKKRENKYSGRKSKLLVITGR